MVQKGDILLFSGKRWYSRIIQCMTLSKYSHAAMYLGGGLIVESDWDGVKVRQYADKYDACTIFRHKNAKPSEVRVATEWAVSQVGSGYDYLGLLGVGLAIIGKKKDNGLDASDRYWCSELVADAYAKAGLDVCADKASYRVSPADLSRCPLLEKVES